MSDELPSQASFWGLREQEIRVLTLVTHWFNGKSLTIRGEERQLGTHHDLPLEEMFRGTDWNYELHEHAHDRLLSMELLQEMYVARRKIDWAPTEQGVRAIRDCLKDRDSLIRPRWAEPTDTGPIYGDPNEGLLHRKGVEVAGKKLPRMAWTHDHRGYSHGKGLVWYPADHRGEACHDLHIDTNEWMDNVGVEVITSSNNMDYLVDKWARHQREDRLTLWVFDRRETACRLWNELDYRGEFYLDRQFQGVENWSAKAINKKVWRSSDKYRREPAGDLIQTVTGLLEGDKDTIYQLFENYYSNN
jgi:hypothetical protein